MTKLVLIHGRAQESFSAANLIDHWTLSMKTGFEKHGLAFPSNVTIELPYYGRQFADWVGEFLSPDAGNVIPKGVSTSGDDAELAYTLELLRGVLANRGVSPEKISALERDGGTTEKGVLNWRPVLALARALEMYGFGDDGISIATKDVWLYLTEKVLNDRVQALVAPAFKPAGEDLVIVAHSLGSIVAYNAINALPDRSHIRGLVTLGSPLGISAVFSRLPSFSSPRKAPIGVGSWLNARDKRDTVALYPIDPAKYQGTPVVENHNEVVNLADNRHGISDYLSDKLVAAKLHGLLKS